MASKLKKVAEDVKSLNKLFSAVKELAESFDEAGKLETLIESYKTEKQKLSKEVESKIDEVKAQEHSVSLILKKKSEALAEIEKIKASADQEKQVVLKGALEERAKILAHVDALKIEVGSLQNEKTAFLSLISKQIDEKKLELESFEEKLKLAKESLKQLVS